MNRLTLVVVTSLFLFNCGHPSAIDSQITIGPTATLERIKGEWFFSAPLNVKMGSDTADWKLATRVVDLSNQWFVSDDIPHDIGKPATFVLPLKTYRQQPSAGALVRLKVEVFADTWDGAFDATSNSSLQFFNFQF